MFNSKRKLLETYGSCSECGKWFKINKKSIKDLEAGARVHGFDPDQMCDDINALIGEE